MAELNNFEETSNDSAIHADHSVLEELVLEMHKAKLSLEQSTEQLDDINNIIRQ